MIESLHNYIFKKEAEYGEMIHHSLNSSNPDTRNITSRVHAVFISAICFIALIENLVYQFSHGIRAIWHGIIHLESPLKYHSNTRNVLVGISELFRQIIGTIAGSLIGIFSPQTAADLCLPPTQKVQETQPSNMTPDEAAKIYFMLAVMHHLFEKNGIDYRISDGTQLGSVRHGAIIPWDDDADTTVSEQDREKILLLKDQLAAYGLELIECPNQFGFKIYPKDGKDLPVDNGLGAPFQYKYPFVDICFDTFKNGKWVPSHIPFQEHFAGAYFTPEEWKSRELIPFGPIKVYGMSDEKAKDYCLRNYGPAWDEYGCSVFSHKSFSIQIPRKFYLKREANGKCAPIKYNEELFKTLYARIK